MCGEKVLRYLMVMLDRGITPACAGKRKADMLDALLGKDHPRVCGEKFACLMPKIDTAGSPPRVRGKECALRR